MGDFIITAPDGKRYKVSGENQAGALAALQQHLGAQSMAPVAPQEDVIATTKDGGRVLRMRDGSLAFSSPGYSTSNQDQIAKIMEGATIKDTVQSGFQQQAIQDNPVAARGAKFIQGVPFLGEYLDETAGLVYGDKAQNAVRYMQDAMSAQKPKESIGLQVGGGVAGSIPMVLAAAPAAMTGGATLAGNVARGAVIGATAGGVEGAVSGYGAGNDGSRMDSAVTRGALGAGVGAVVGAAAPAVAKGISNAWQSLRGTDVKTIAKELSISEDAAKVVKSAIEQDDLTAASAAIQKAGSNAMLADAGPAAQSLLDASMNAGGAAARVARGAVEDRAAQSGQAMQAALDKYLGAPAGIQSIGSGIREGTAAARSAAYDAAYAAPINYAGGGGRAIEALLKRVPKAAYARANELMRLEGVQSQQIMASFADDGTVTLTRMPDVRQIDYITRALNDVADAADGAGKLGGTTQLGRATSSLSKSLRSALRGEVPAYGEALDTAADAISQKKASDLGYSLLRAGTTRETVRDALEGASKAERDAAKQGLRAYIDDTLSNVRRTITDNNVDAREAIKVMGDLSSKASREKLTVLLGKDAAPLLRDIEREAMSLELRAALAANSKTAVRQAVQGAVSDVTSPGALSTLLQGEPLNAGKRIAQVLTGQTKEAVALRQQGIYAEIAQALTEKRGAEAQKAIVQINRAMQGQPLTQEQANQIARALTAGVSLTGYQTTMQSLPK